LGVDPSVDSLALEDYDHIEPVGSQPPWPPTGDGEWDKYLAGLFCDETNLQALCVDCHKIKTREEHRAGVY